MPKAQTPSTRDSAPFKHNINSLKRNQACHQCRKRKLKCDAKRPCSTCQRSHAYALSHAPPSERAALPKEPECTYDEVSIASPQEQAPPPPKTRYEKLESRINELESLLREKATGSSSSSPGDSGPSSSTRDEPSTVGSISNRDLFNSLPTTDTIPSSSDSRITDWADVFFGAASSTSNTSQDFSQYAPMDSLESLAIAAMMGESSQQQTSHISPPQNAHVNSADSPPNDSRPATTSTPSMSDSGYSPSPLLDTSQGMLYLAWPPNLPEPVVTRHLIQAFFSHVVHASRLFHAPSFFSSLNLHPSDPGFPARAILHAMCAVGSFYTSSYPSGHIIDSYAWDPVTRTRRPGISGTTTFAQEQVKLAKQAIEDDLDQGRHLFGNLQARIILHWYFLSQAKWIDSCLTSAMSMRCCVTLALNVTPPFQGLSVQIGNDRPPSLLPPATSIIEEEVRRNTFWIAYCLDRQAAAGNGWAMNIDENDIHTLLPLRQDQFEQGILIHPSDRQFSHLKETVTTFPEDQTDPFIMYCKASIVMARVKNFVLRYKAMQSIDEPDFKIPDGAREVPGVVANPSTIRLTPAFVELNKTINTMKSSFPPHLRNVMQDGKLDKYAYGAWNIIHLAHIHLHEPFAKPGSQQCWSAVAILTSARAIVDVLHIITSTSYDVSLMDTYAFVCWYMAGRILVRFLKAAQDMQSPEQIIPLRAEVSFLRGMLLKAGDRIPLAFCYYKMLQAVIVQTGVDLEDREVMGSTSQSQANIHSQPMSSHQTMPSQSMSAQQTSSQFHYMSQDQVSSTPLSVLS